MSVILQSRVRRMQVFLLPHALCCHDRCSCVEVSAVVVAQNRRTGEQAPKRIDRKVPGSLTVLARARTPRLPNAVLQIPDVKVALDRGYLQVIEQSAEPAAVAPPAASTSNPAAPLGGTAAPSSTPDAAPAASGSSAASKPPGGGRT